jgi:hypothetical protein
MLHASRGAQDYAADVTPPAVERRTPPKEPFVVVNAVVKRLARSPLHGVLGGRIAVLRFTGRRSGRQYETPVGVHELDGALLTLTNSPWKANLREPARVGLLRRGVDTAWTATLDEDPERVAEVYRRLIERMGHDRAGRQLGLRINVDRMPTSAELRDAVVANGLAVVHYTPA